MSSTKRSWAAQLLFHITKSHKPKDRKEAFRLVTSCGIKPEMIQGPERYALAHIIEYVDMSPHSSGSVPDVQTLREKYPNLVIPDQSSSNLEEVVRRIQEGHVRRKVTTHLNEYEINERHDPMAALYKLQEKLENLILSNKDNHDRVFDESAVESVVEELQFRKKNQGVTGLPFPWKELSSATHGIQPEDLVIIYALPKSMKTWIAMLIVVKLAMLGYRTLIFSKEMSWDKVKFRIAAILTDSDYTSMMKGYLSDEEIADIKEILMAFVEHKKDLIMFTKAMRIDGSRGGPKELEKKAEDFGADVIFADSAYQLEPSGGESKDYHRKLNMISTGLKECASSSKIPVIAVFQENERQAIKMAKKSRGTASVAGSTAIVQDADVMMRVVYNPFCDELSLHLPAARETKHKGITINAVPAVDFTYAGDHLHYPEDVHGAELEQQGYASNSKSALAEHGSTVATNEKPQF